MAATDPTANTFGPLRTVDPRLDRIRENWTRSGRDRTQYQGPLAEELDYYHTTISGQIGLILYELSHQTKSPDEVKALTEHLGQLADITDGIASFLFSHLLNFNER